MKNHSLHRRSVLLGFAGFVGLPLVSKGSGATFRRGINLHHLLNWPLGSRVAGRHIYTWPPFRSSRFQISDDELRELRSVGFDFVRLTIDPSILIASEPARRLDLKAILIGTVRRLLDQGFGVIADLHPVAVNPDYAPQALVDEKNPAAFEAFRAIVAEVAGWLAPLSEQKLIFELMNEPILSGEAGFRRWQGMLAALHDSARQAAPHLALLLTGANWGSLRALMRLETKAFSHSNVFYTFHYYDPHSFTHQGVGKEHARYLTDLSWPARTETFEAAFQRAVEKMDRDRSLTGQARELASATTRKLITDYIQTGHDHDRIATDFAALAGWGRQNGISLNRIILGEFGCVRHEGQLRARAAGLHWLAAVRQEAERHEFPWAFWAYKGHGGMALRDDRPNAALDIEQLRALALGPS